MTHPDVITFNECKNDGSTIYLYRNVTAGNWLAYGISAYLLKTICETNSINCIESYSDEILMPCVSVMDITNIVNALEENDSDKSYHILKSNCVVNDAMYAPWAMQLCSSFRDKIK